MMTMMMKDGNVSKVLGLLMDVFNKWMYNFLNFRV